MTYDIFFCLDALMNVESMEVQKMGGSVCLFHWQRWCGKSAGAGYSSLVLPG